MKIINFVFEQPNFLKIVLFEYQNTNFLCDIYVYRLCVCLFLRWKPSRRCIEATISSFFIFTVGMVCKRVSATNKQTSKHRIYLPFFS